MDDARWSAGLAHRERLLRIARARLPQPDDAEDVVQEALLRCVEFEDLDVERIGPFLTSVTIRLCADVHRRAGEPARAKRWMGPLLHHAADPAEVVCRQAEATWVASLVAELPDRQRSVLVDRADGMSIPQISDRYELTYKSVESALSRARSAVRAAVAAALALSGLAVRHRRVVAVATVPAVTLALTGLVLVAPPGGDPADAGTSPPRVVPFRPTAPRETVAVVAPGPARAVRAQVRPPAGDEEPGRPAASSLEAHVYKVHAEDEPDEYSSAERVQHCADYGAEYWVRPKDPPQRPDVFFQCRYPPNS